MTHGASLLPQWNVKLFKATKSDQVDFNKKRPRVTQQYATSVENALLNIV